MRDTIDMAREVESEVGFQWCVNFIELARFEALVRADERKHIAKFVEDVYVRQFKNPWREDLATAIRARGQA